MRAKRKCLSVLLSLVLIVGLCPAPAFAGQLQATGASLSTQAAVSMSQSEYNSKSNAFINDGRWRNDAAFSNANGPKLSTYGSAGCFAYACDFTAYMYGINSIRYGSSFSNKNDIRQGDVIQVNGGGHTIVVLGRNGNSLYTAEGNWSGAVRVANGAYTVSGLNFYTGWHYVDVYPDQPQVVSGSEMAGGYGRTIPDGDYAIVLTSTLGSDTFYYLDMAGVEAPAANGTNVNLWSSGGKPAQLADCDLWTVKYDGGFYTITQKGTGAALDVDGASLNQEANVQAWGSNGTPAQKWAISANGGGYRLEAKCSGFSLDVSGGKLENGTNIWMYSDNDTDAQRWSFVPVGRDMARASIPPIASEAYTGAAITPKPKVTWSGIELVEGTDYDIRYSNNVAAGTATITLVGKGSYVGTRTATFDIIAPDDGKDGEPAAGDDDPSSPGIGENERDDDAGDLVEADDEDEGYEGVDYEGEDASDPDEDDEGYGDDEGLYDLADADVFNVYSRIYTGKAQVQSPMVLLDGVPLDEGDDYVISYRDNVNAGMATMTLEGAGAYTGSQSITFAISKANVKGSAAAKVKAKRYTGRAIKPSPKITYKGKVLEKGVDYTLAYKNNKKRGTATITVRGKGNFKGTKAITFKIK